MRCPFCGGELKVEHEPMTGGDILYCENCGAEGYGYYEADGSYHLSIESSAVEAGEGEGDE